MDLKIQNVLSYSVQVVTEMKLKYIWNISYIHMGIVICEYMHLSLDYFSSNN